MLNADEYIHLPRETRQSHLKLDEPCIERGGISTQHKGVLAQYLNSTIPSGKVLLLHACNNAKCSNPVHLYWGTPYENICIDSAQAGTFRSVWDRAVSKYGYEEACKRNKRSSLSAKKAGQGNKGVPKSEDHKKNISLSLRKRSAGVVEQFTQVT